MFGPWCSRCGCRVLLGYDRIVRLHTTATGHLVVLRCRCGDLIHLTVAVGPPDAEQRRSA